MSTPDRHSSANPHLPFVGLLGPVFEYATDAFQRSALFWDVLRERGNNYKAHIEKTAPHVLNYDVELVMDGREFDRPVNYALVRVLPPASRWRAGRR